MVGVVVMIIVLVVVLPVFFLVGGALIAAVLGSSLKANGEAVNEGSELIDTNI